MLRFQIPRRRLLFILLGLVVTIPVCIYLSLVIAFTISTSNGGFKFIPQDCNGVPISVAGRVQNTEREPIVNATVVIKYVATDNSKKFSFTVTTDKNGKFIYPKALSIFVCDDLTFDASARGFKDKSVRYSLFDDHKEADISTTRVNNIFVAITLERSS